MRLIACRLAVLALVSLVALPAGAAGRAPDAVAGASCSKETKRLKKFQRGMKAAKRRYFRSHRSAKARKRFVKAQRRKLAAFKRARRRCLAKPAPAPPPVVVPPGPVPPPAGGGGQPPPGPPASPPARDSIQDVISSAARFTPAEVSTEHGVEYVRTQLELELKRGATKAAMDAVLARLHAKVVSSLEGVGLLTVRIPDPGSLAAARALVAGLATDPALAAAQLGTVPVTTDLPSTFTPADAGLVRPQLASRAAGMWNARAGLVGATAPTLVVTDYFGAGPPGPEVAVAETAADFATTGLNAHGYTMLGLAAGTFDPGAVADLQADQVTGMWAGPDLPLRVVDLQTAIAGSTLEDRLLLLIGSLPGDVVVSTSLAAGCAPTACTAPEIRTDALQWIDRVRGAGLEGRFVHVVAAGNIYPTLLFDTEARFGSHFIAAAKSPLPVANLSNTIVVENTTASDPASGPIVPVCLTDTSKRGGDVSTVGNDIKSLGGPGVFRDLPLGGTSSAAPQAAGTAATVWALAPGLTPAGVVGILRRTARPVDVDASDARCTTVPPAPALDAYSATLAADSAAAEPARAAVLDVDGDGDFDELDLAAFRDAFVASTSDGVVDLDYGRYDLNGDGYTGGGRDRIDLDASSPVAWTFSRRRDVLGLEIGHDENSVRDLDVLCHEANGPLYAGDAAARDTFDEQYCLPPVALTADPAFPATLNPGQTATLRIVARRTDLTDPAVSQQPGVHLDFALASGTLAAVDGTTGPDGAFSTTASLGPTGDFEVEVIARAGVGGPELDRLTVTAARGSGPLTSFEAHTFLVANAEASDDVKESSDPAYSDTVSAADKDATASATFSSTFAHSAGGFTFTGVADIDAADDGGGGDASAFMTRRFVIGETLFYRLRATLEGADPEETVGVISLGATGAPNPPVKLTTFESKTFSGQLAPGDYELTAEVDCSPGNEGGPCSGSFDVDLDAGDFITP